MKKLLKAMVICLVAAALFWTGSLIADRRSLNEELIRFHVIAKSDSEEDQTLKLQVRDTVIARLNAAMADISDVKQAKAYLAANLSMIEETANRALREAGCDDEAVVTLTRESYDTRYYDTFTLPAGVYESLRITIGEGQGKNWWCVVFPTLCIPATTEGFGEVAAGAGFSDTLTAALEGEDGYEIRFYLLDLLGRLEATLDGR